MSQKSEQGFKKYLFDSPESAASALAEKVINQTQSSIQKNSKCVWALSGGSSIHKLYDALRHYGNELQSISKIQQALWSECQGPLNRNHCPSAQKLGGLENPAKLQ